MQRLWVQCQTTGFNKHQLTLDYQTCRHVQSQYLYVSIFDSWITMKLGQNDEMNVNPNITDLSLFYSRFILNESWMMTLTLHHVANCSSKVGTIWRKRTELCFVSTHRDTQARLFNLSIPAPTLTWEIRGLNQTSIRHCCDETGVCAHCSLNIETILSSIINTIVRVDMIT